MIGLSCIIPSVYLPSLNCPKNVFFLSAGAWKIARVRLVLLKSPLSVPSDSSAQGLRKMIIFIPSQVWRREKELREHLV